jgi:hypothetical protein
MTIREGCDPFPDPRIVMVGRGSLRPSCVLLFEKHHACYCIANGCRLQDSTFCTVPRQGGNHTAENTAPSDPDVPDAERGRRSESRFCLLFVGGLVEHRPPQLHNARAGELVRLAAVFPHPVAVRWRDEAVEAARRGRAEQSRGVAGAPSPSRG